MQSREMPWAAISPFVPRTSDISTVKSGSTRLPARVTIRRMQNRQSISDWERGISSFPVLSVPLFPDTSYARLTPFVGGRNILDHFRERFQGVRAITKACGRSKSHRHEELGCCHGRSEKAHLQVSTQYAAFARCGASVEVAILLPVRDRSSFACHLSQLWLLSWSADDSAAG